MLSDLEITSARAARQIRIDHRMVSRRIHVNPPLRSGDAHRFQRIDQCFGFHRSSRLGSLRKCMDAQIGTLAEVRQNPIPFRPDAVDIRLTGEALQVAMVFSAIKRHEIGIA